ncbi:MAG: hypothetical protein ABI594_01595 [Ginsengibacter sp.]
MKAVVLICFLFVSCLSFGQNADEIIRQANQCEAAMNDMQALSKYKEAIKIQPGNIYAICKVSEICSRIGARLKNDKASRVNYFRDAKTYAHTAVQLNPANSEANFVMALVMGRDALDKGGEEKIKAVKDIKYYADLSIKYDPKNYKAWYILGKWYYEVSSLNYFERTAVKIFFGALPSAKIDDAIKCLEKTRSLNPGFILNYLSLAQAYKRKDNEAMAKQNLAYMFSLPDKTQDDTTFKSEGRGLLKKWN